ncbi:uncharacterized protein [Acropora muricata]|uniref:uncharacterized protein isoform X1 n=1 Tax=Acropora muricata TaxID=159855 RepID=UPI0034E3DB21
MVCYWLYAVIVCFKAIAFLHVSLVDARVHPKGMEIKSLKLCGSDHSNAKIEITPWPFIAYEHIFNVTISLTPAVNIFEIIAAFEIIKLPGGQILFKSRRDVCIARDDWCTVLAGDDDKMDNEIVQRRPIRISVRGYSGFKELNKISVKDESSAHFQLFFFSARSA